MISFQAIAARSDDIIHYVSGGVSLISIIGAAIAFGKLSNSNDSVHEKIAAHEELDNDRFSKIDSRFDKIDDNMEKITDGIGEIKEHLDIQRGIELERQRGILKTRSGDTNGLQ